MDRRQEAKALLEAARKKRKGQRGRPPRPLVDIVIAGPPAYSAENAWDEAKERAWAKDAMEFVRFLGMPVMAAALHRDENSPHIHALCLPVEKGNLVGWTAIKRRLANVKEGQRLDGQRLFSGFQDLLFDIASQKHGLARGERGRKRKHKRVSKAESLARLELERSRTAERKAALEAGAEAAEKKKRNAEAAIAALRSQAEALKTERSRLLSKVKLARLLLKEGLGHISKRRISARELMELGRELMRGEGPRGGQLAEPAVSDLPIEELIELAERKKRKRNYTAEQIERISQAREECKRRGIALSPGRTRRAPRRRGRAAAR